MILVDTRNTINMCQTFPIKKHTYSSIFKMLDLNISKKICGVISHLKYAFHLSAMAQQ